MRAPRTLALVAVLGLALAACDEQPTAVGSPDQPEAPVMGNHVDNPTSIFYDGPMPLEEDFAEDGPFTASQLGQPVPDEVIVSKDGLEWVWASPCTDLRPPNGTGCSLGIDVGHDGFEYATDDQWAIRPAVSDFLGDNGLKCASPWFEHAYDHCDYGDAAAGYYGSSPDWQSGPNGGSRHPNAETWLVRVADPQTKDDCKKGGWEQYGFKNQGQCVRFIETGKDSR